MEYKGHGALINFVLLNQHYYGGQRSPAVCSYWKHTYTEILKLLPMTEIVVPDSPPQEMHGFAASMAHGPPVHSEPDIDIILPSQRASLLATSSETWYTESMDTAQHGGDFTNVEVCMYTH